MTLPTEKIEAVMEAAREAKEGMPPDGSSRFGAFASLYPEYGALYALCAPDFILSLCAEALASRKAGGAALGASERACYLWPGEDQAPLRDAFVQGVLSALEPGQTDQVSISPPPPSGALPDAEPVKEALKDTLGSLVAAVSLLERGGKKAAPSDKMFRVMLSDYHKSIAKGRAALKGAQP